MNKLMISILTLSATLVGFGIQANECSYQPNEYYIQENDCDSEGYDCEDECPCIDRGFYVGGFAGPGFLDYNGSVGFTGGIAAGYKFEKNFRLEAEFAYRFHEFHRVKFNTYSFMANALYDLPQIYGFTPYIGFGLGYGRTAKRSQHFGYSLTSHGNDFVMQGIFGVSRKVWNDLHLGLEYRIFGNDSDIYDHSVVVSLKRFF